MNRLIEDISALTTISQNALSNLMTKVQFCICHCVYEGIIEGKNPVDIDIGVGTLYIKFEEDEIKYKFIPSKKLEESVSCTVMNKVSPLVDEVDATLKNRIENTYKNLL